jgi:hypothetical protein
MEESFHNRGATVDGSNISVNMYSAQESVSSPLLPKAPRKDVSPSGPPLESTLDAILVPVRVTILGLKAIDTVAQFVSAEVFFEFYMRHPDVETMDWEALCSGGYKALLDVHFINLIEDALHTIDVWVAHFQDDAPRDAFRLRYRVKGRFAQHFNLSTFPFDLQRLRFGAMARKDTTKIILVPYCDTNGLHEDKYIMVADKDNNFISAEFTIIHPTRLELECSVSESDTSASGSQYSRFFVFVRVLRKPWYYLSNFVFMLLIVVCTTATAFAIPVVDIGGNKGEAGSRLEVLMTLLLAIVSFKYVIAQSIPKIGYSSWMDYFVHICVLAIVAALAESALAATNIAVAKEENLIIIAGAVCFLLAVFGHCAYGYGVHAFGKRAPTVKQGDSGLVRTRLSPFYMQHLSLMKHNPLVTPV